MAEGNEMYPARDVKTGLYGYWSRGQWGIHPEFRFALGFHDGYAFVTTKDRRPGLVTGDGTYLSLESICEGRSIVEDTFLGFVDQILPSSMYGCVGTVSDGHREWGTIDHSLAYQSLPVQLFADVTSTDCCGEYITVTRRGGTPDDGRSGLFSRRDRRMVLPCEYSCIYPSSESIWVAARVGSNQRTSRDVAFFEINESRRISPWFFCAKPFSCGYAVVNEEGESWHYVNRSLQRAFDRQFDGAERFSYGLAAVYRDEDAGYLDTSGHMRLLLPYERLSPFNRFGWAIANRNELDWDLDIIDRQGQARLCGFETAVFWDGDFPYFQLSKEGKEILVDMELNTVIEER